MALRINEKRFFLDTYRTHDDHSATNKEQANCEKRIEKIFRDFLAQKSTLGSE